VFNIHNALFGLCVQAMSEKSSKHSGQRVRYRCVDCKRVFPSNHRCDHLRVYHPGEPNFESIGLPVRVDDPPVTKARTKNPKSADVTTRAASRGSSKSMSAGSSRSASRRAASVGRSSIERSRSPRRSVEVRPSCPPKDSKAADVYVRDRPREKRRASGVGPSIATVNDEIHRCALMAYRQVALCVKQEEVIRTASVEFGCLSAEVINACVRSAVSIYAQVVKDLCHRVPATASAVSHRLRSSSSSDSRSSSKSLSSSSSGLSGKPRADSEPKRTASGSPLRLMTAGELVAGPVSLFDVEICGSPHAAVKVNAVASKTPIVDAKDQRQRHMRTQMRSSLSSPSAASPRTSSGSLAPGYKIPKRTKLADRIEEMLRSEEIMFVADVGIHRDSEGMSQLGSGTLSKELKCNTASKRLLPTALGRAPDDDDDTARAPFVAARPSVVKDRGNQPVCATGHDRTQRGERRRDDDRHEVDRRGDDRRDDDRHEVNRRGDDRRDDYRRNDSRRDDNRGDDGRRDDAYDKGHRYGQEGERQPARGHSNAFRRSRGWGRGGGRGGTPRGYSSNQDIASALISALDKFR